ncbi:MAG: hypothetical protein GC136_07800 [Alphaproteobacteria bacterium]|nr:hypothetical protein [Alphaproteobacteria bacterium]
MLNWDKNRILGLFNAGGANAPQRNPDSSGALMTPIESSGATIVLSPDTFSPDVIQHMLSIHADNSDQEVGFYRIIDGQRAWIAAESGTDRTSGSRVHALRGDAVAMNEHGITDPAQVTYLKPVRGKIPTPEPGQSVLVYSTGGIKKITTTSTVFPNNSLFSFTGDPRDSLLAVITFEPPPNNLEAATGPVIRPATP